MLNQSATKPSASRLFPAGLGLIFLFVCTAIMTVWSTPSLAASGIVPGQRILKVKMTRAMCEISPSRSRLRQCLEGYALTISGLDLGYGNNCRPRPNSTLPPLQLQTVSRVMPDAAIRNRAWAQYGACSPLSPQAYFRQVTNHASELKLPREISMGNSYTLTKSQFVQQITQLNTGLTAQGIDLICQSDARGTLILKEIHICYGQTGFMSCPRRVDNCGNRIVISGG